MAVAPSQPGRSDASRMARLRKPEDVPDVSRSRVRCRCRHIMVGMSRVVSVAVVLAVIAACSLILLHAFRGHGQPGTVIDGGKTYDCHKVLQSFESTRGPGVYPQSVIDACVNSQAGGTQP